MSKKEPERIAVGTTVKLNDQGKTGTVMAFMPKYGGEVAKFKTIVSDCNGKQMFDFWDSAFDRYLVRCDREGKRGSNLKPHFFAPIAGSVERLNRVSKAK